MAQTTKATADLPQWPAPGSIPPHVAQLIEIIRNQPQGKEHARRRLQASGIIDEHGNLTDTYTKPQGVSRADSRVYLRDYQGEAKD